MSSIKIEKKAYYMVQGVVWSCDQQSFLITQDHEWSWLNFFFNISNNDLEWSFLSSSSALFERLSKPLPYDVLYFKGSLSLLAFPSSFPGNAKPQKGTDPMHQCIIHIAKYSKNGKK